MGELFTFELQYRYIYVSFIPQAVYLLYDKPLTVVKVGLAPSGDPPNLAF